VRCIQRHTAYASRADVVRLIILADTHLGNASADERSLRMLAEQIKREPLTYWCHLGDMCEYINLHDPRFDPSDLAGWMMTGETLCDIGRAETRRFLDIMAPVRDKCLAIVQGNHERQILRHSEVDAYGVLVEGLADGENDHRLDDRGFVTWVFRRGDNGGKWALRMFLTHGWAGGRSAGNAANKLGQLAQQVDGVDVIAMGHLHDPAYRPMAVMRPGPRRHRTTTVHTISAPALVSQMAYGEAVNMPPHPTGWAEVHITPDKQTMSVELVTT